MGDSQMAADLIGNLNYLYVSNIVYSSSCSLSERALYSFETIFHPLFNYTQANCRLDYNQAENRYTHVNAIVVFA